MTADQLLPPIGAELRAALKADIAARGVLVPVEIDEDGNPLDGHERMAIAAELGLACPTVVRAGLSEAEKIEHSLKLNVLRRDPGPVVFADAFSSLAAARGVRLGTPGRQKAVTLSALAAELGVSPRTARRRLRQTADVRRLAPALVGAFDRGEVTVGEVREQARQAAIRRLAADIAARPRPLPAGPFEVIVADPPWDFDELPAEEQRHRGRVSYPTMTVATIEGLPVGALAAPDAVLWLWTTNACLEDAFRVVRAWGFRYKTMLTWVKPGIGTGRWLRGQSEPCLFAIRGRPILTLAAQSTVLQAPARGHSRKPDEFFALVGSLCPGTKVELFARQRREGWTTWGAEVPYAGTDIRPLDASETARAGAA